MATDMHTVQSAWMTRFMNITDIDDMAGDDAMRNTHRLGTDDSDYDEHFRRCWRRQGCKSCLGIPSCSWCPFSAVCVPNDHLIPALAPAFDGNLVCPYWAERWEVRTRPLGCQVSTVTSLTALVAGSGTLVVAALCIAVVVGVRRLRQRRRASTSIPIDNDDHPSDTPDTPESTPSNANETPDERAPLLPR